MKIRWQRLLSLDNIQFLCFKRILPTTWHCRHGVEHVGESTVCGWSQGTVGLLHGGKLRRDHVLLQSGIVEHLSKAVAVVPGGEDSL